MKDKNKEHVYLPYLNDADSLAHVFTDVPALKPDEAGFLQFTIKRATVDLAPQHMDN